MNRKFRRDFSPKKTRLSFSKDRKMDTGQTKRSQCALLVSQNIQGPSLMERLSPLLPLSTRLEPLCLLLGSWIQWASSHPKFSSLALHQETLHFLNKPFMFMPPYSGLPSLSSILVVVLFIFQGPAQLSASLLPSPNAPHTSFLCFLTGPLE